MEAEIRLAVALGVFLVMISWEYYSPRRTLDISRQHRWPVNIGLAILNIVLVRMTIGGIAYLSAVNALEKGWGVLHLFATPEWVSVLITLLVMDVVIYAQHILAHKWEPLWRLHQVHHADLAFDATTAVRFHPLEIVFSLAIKVAVIYLLGANPIAVLAFEVILNATATFNHSNVRIPVGVDKWGRWIMVTPDMHRIHHSCVQSERDSNYGFSVSWWDRLFKTYTPEPQKPQTEFDIGLKTFRKTEQVGFLQLLVLPFKPLCKHK